MEAPIKTYSTSYSVNHTQPEVFLHAARQSSTPTVPAKIPMRSPSHSPATKHWGGSAVAELVVDDAVVKLVAEVGVSGSRDGVSGSRVVKCCEHTPVGNSSRAKMRWLLRPIDIFCSIT